MHMFWPVRRFAKTTVGAIAFLGVGWLPTPVAADWIDSKSGQRVADFPVITAPDGKTDWVRPDNLDRDHPLPNFRISRGLE